MIAVAALYVEKRGVYSTLDGVDLWDEGRDARMYPGPHPVVAHPPCERWGRYAKGGPSAKHARRVGDDHGCFKSALSDLRRWGGVLEHPAHSKAWEFFGLARPPSGGGWVPAQLGLLTCHVEQGHYGHAARKATWLLVSHMNPFGAIPELCWGPSSTGVRIDPGYHSAEEARAARAAPGYVPTKRLSKAQRVGTPPEFARLLVDLARRAS